MIELKEWHWRHVFSSIPIPSCIFHSYTALNCRLPSCRLVRLAFLVSSSLLCILRGGRTPNHHQILRQPLPKGRQRLWKHLLQRNSWRRWLHLPKWHKALSANHSVPWDNRDTRSPIPRGFFILISQPPPEPVWPSAPGLSAVWPAAPTGSDSGPDCATTPVHQPVACLVLKAIYWTGKGVLKYFGTAVSIFTHVISWTKNWCPRYILPHSWESHRSI